MEVILVVLAASILIWCASHPILWSWRTVGVVILALVGTEAVIRSGLPLGPLVAGVGWAGIFSLALFGHRSLRAMRSRDQDFVEAFYEQRRELAKVFSEHGEIGRLEYAARLREMASRFQALVPPDAEWAELRDDVVRDLLNRSVVLEKPRVAPEIKREMQANWDALEARWIGLQRSHMTFWLTWP